MRRRPHRRPSPTVNVLDRLPDTPELTPAAVCFGNFDGVHVGHQTLLAEVRTAADRLGGPACAVTFDPHPLTLLRPEAAPPAVDTLAGRLRGLQACGIDRALVLRFDAELAAKPAEWFARDVLCRALGARWLVAGNDVRFGHGGQGNLALLQAIAGEFGAVVQTCPPLFHAGQVVSSSRVRAAVAAGRVEEAAVLLGRPFCLRGTVVQGDQRGRQLGFPTANVAAPSQVRPAAGVYACLFEGDDGVLHDAVANAGMRPTFAGDRWQVEAHLLEWQGDLYGRPAHLHLVARLRDEQRFAGLDALIAQIRHDIAAARLALRRWRDEGSAP